MLLVLAVGLWRCNVWVNDELGWGNDAVPFEQMPDGLPGARSELPISCGNSDNTRCTTTVEYEIEGADRCEVAGRLAVFFAREGATDDVVDDLLDGCNLSDFVWEDGTVTWMVTDGAAGDNRLKVTTEAHMGPGREIYRR